MIKGVNVDDIIRKLVLAHADNEIMGIALVFVNEKLETEIEMSFAAGEADIRCLSLDHVNNDGHIDKKTSGGKRQVTPTWYAKLYKLLKTNQPLPRELQLLCFNCHAKKDLQPWWFKDGVE